MNTNVPANINGQSTSAQALAAAMGLGALSPAMQAHLASQQGRPSDDLGGGITTGFAVVSLRGKVWRIKHRGEEKVVLNEKNEPRYSLEVIIVKASPNIAKIFYKDGYVEGSTAPPDCWSVNGRVPDPASPALQFPENAGKTGPTCAGCWANAWGSRASAQGSKGKACADSKRIAIVPMDDPKNEFYGGPMLQRIPPASLGDLKAYADKLNQIGLPYYAVATRISFDMSAEYPKLVFEPIRVLTDEEASVILEMQKGALVERILDTAIDMVETSGVDTTGADAFKQLQGQAVPAAMQQAPQQAPQTAPEPATVASAAEQVLAVTQPPQANPEALPEGWQALPGGKFYHAEHGLTDKLPEPPKPEPVTPEVTPALDMADFTPLPGGKFYQISTGQVLDKLPEPPAPEPAAPPVTLVPLPGGKFYNPDTGEVVDGNGASAALPPRTEVQQPAPAPAPQQAAPVNTSQPVTQASPVSGPVSPSGRVYGKPREGLKKRNSQEVAEDNAYFASQGQAAPAAEPEPAPAPAPQASPLEAVASQFAAPAAEPEILPPAQATQAENAGLPSDFANMLDGMLGSK